MRTIPEPKLICSKPTRSVKCSITNEMTHRKGRPENRRLDLLGLQTPIPLHWLVKMTSSNELWNPDPVSTRLRSSCVPVSSLLNSHEFFKNDRADYFRSSVNGWRRIFLRARLRAIACLIRFFSPGFR